MEFNIDYIENKGNLYINEDSPLNQVILLLQDETTNPDVIVNNVNQIISNLTGNYPEFIDVKLVEELNDSDLIEYVAVFNTVSFTRGYLDCWEEDINDTIEYILNLPRERVDREFYRYFPYSE